MNQSTLLLLALLEFTAFTFAPTSAYYASDTLDRKAKIQLLERLSRGLRTEVFTSGPCRVLSCERRELNYTCLLFCNQISVDLSVLAESLFADKRVQFTYALSTVKFRSDNVNSPIDSVEPTQFLSFEVLPGLSGDERLPFSELGSPIDLRNFLRTYSPFMDIHLRNIGNRVLPYAKSCCLSLAAGISLFIIYPDPDAVFTLYEDGTKRITISVRPIATVLVTGGSVVFVISLFLWGCVYCMRPKSQPGVILGRSTSEQTFVTVEQPGSSGITYTPAVLQPPSAPSLPMPAPQPPQYTAPPPYPEKAIWTNFMPRQSRTSVASLQYLDNQRQYSALPRRLKRTLDEMPSRMSYRSV
ncbi:hypothetical protein SprV_0902750600 [Sparganum proliferum]